MAAFGLWRALARRPGARREAGGDRRGAARAHARCLVLGARLLDRLAAAQIIGPRPRPRPGPTGASCSRTSGSTTCRESRQTDYPIRPISGGYPLLQVWITQGWGAFGWLEVKFGRPGSTAFSASSPSCGAGAAPRCGARRRAIDWRVASFLALACLSLLAGLHWTDYHQLGGARVHAGALPVPGDRGVRRRARGRGVGSAARVRPAVAGGTVAALFVFHLFAFGLVLSSVLCVAPMPGFLAVLAVGLALWPRSGSRAAPTLVYALGVPPQQAGRQLRPAASPARGRSGSRRRRRSSAIGSARAAPATWTSPSRRCRPGRLARRASPSAGPDRHAADEPRAVGARRWTARSPCASQNSGTRAGRDMGHASISRRRPTSATLDGTPLNLDMAMHVRARASGRSSRCCPTMAERASVFRPGWLSPAVYPMLAPLVVVGVPALLSWRCAPRRVSRRRSSIQSHGGRRAGRVSRGDAWSAGATSGARARWPDDRRGRRCRAHAAARAGELDGVRAAGTAITRRPGATGWACCILPRRAGLAAVDARRQRPAAAAFHPQRSTSRPARGAGPAMIARARWG